MTDNRYIELEPRRVGDRKPLTIESVWGKGNDTYAEGTARTPQTATFLGLDPGRPTSGTITAGTSTTFQDTGRAEANDFWNGCPVLIRKASGVNWWTEVQDYASGTQTFTIPHGPAAPEADDTYELPAYPLLPQTAASLSTNQGSYTVSSSDLLGYAGDRVIIYRADFGDEELEQVFYLRVMPSR